MSELKITPADKTCSGLDSSPEMKEWLQKMLNAMALTKTAVEPMEDVFSASR